MIIVFGNQKGGAGKSTLAMLFANYLTLVMKKTAIILDMDYQHSILTRYEKAKVFDNPEPYEVLGIELEGFPSIIDVLKANENLDIIIDLPGKVDDDDLFPVLKAADVFIVPFAYDELTYVATQIWNMLVNDQNPEAHKVFVPNRLKNSVNYTLAKEVNQDFSKYGTVTPPLTDRVAFQRIFTKEIPNDLIPLVAPVFDLIIKETYHVKK